MGGAKTDESPRAFFRRVWDALLRVGALVLFGFIHYWMEKAIPLLVPRAWNGVSEYVEEISFLFFLAIYLYLLWDMLKVFVPWLQAKPYPESKSENKK